jgi:hypothetical protein
MHETFVVQQLKMFAQWLLVDYLLELVLGSLLRLCPFTYLRFCHISKLLQSLFSNYCLWYWTSPTELFAPLQISPTEIRGALGSVNQLFICIGILAALVAGLPLAQNPAWWVFSCPQFFVFLRCCLLNLCLCKRSCWRSTSDFWTHGYHVCEQMQLWGWKLETKIMFCTHLLYRKGL